MKKQTIIATIMAALVIMSSFVSCTKSEADEGNIFDFTNKKTVESSLSDVAQVKITDKNSNTVTLEEVKKLVDEAVRICSSYDAVKFSDDEQVLVCEDVSYIDLDYVKTLNPENYGEEYDKFHDFYHNIYYTFLKLLDSRFPENAVSYIDFEEIKERNIVLPSGFYIMDIDATGYKTIEELFQNENVYPPEYNKDVFGCEYIYEIVGYIFYANTATSEKVQLFPISEQLEILKAFDEISEYSHSPEYIEEQVYKLHGVVVDLDE